jgi:hypothetical protein
VGLDEKSLSEAFQSTRLDLILDCFYDFVAASCFLVLTLRPFYVLAYFRPVFFSFDRVLSLMRYANYFPELGRPPKTLSQQ